MGDTDKASAVETLLFHVAEEPVNEQDAARRNRTDVVLWTMASLNYSLRGKILFSSEKNFEFAPQTKESAVMLPLDWEWRHDNADCRNNYYTNKNEWTDDIYLINKQSETVVQ